MEILSEISPKLWRGRILNHQVVDEVGNTGKRGWRTVG